MTSRPSASLVTLGCALLLGVAWRLAAVHLPSQLDLVASLAALLAVIAALAHAGILSVPMPDRLLLGIPAMLLLGAMAWRDEEALVALDAAAIVGLVALAVPGPAGRPLVMTGAWDWLSRGVRAGLGWTFGAIPASWGALAALPGAGGTRAIGAPVLGLAAVAPVLLVFGSLLGSADPLFGDVLQAIFAVELWRLGPDALAVAGGTWCAAGLLWTMSRPAREALPPGHGLRAPVASVVAALVAIEALFGLFMLLQARYLFGGRAHVLATEGLTLAEYARGGFFELVAVAALTVPVLMTAEWAVDADDAAARRRLRVHAWGVLGLLALLLASALSRMLLYTATFGLTQQRLYVVVFMGWLACVLAWFAATSLAGVRHRFLGGALAAGVQALLLLNLGNPEAIVVRVNVARAASGRPVDASYLAGLGAGALPALLARADRLPPADACRVLDAQRARLDRAPGGRRAWNVERARAAGPLRDGLERAAARACGVRS